MALSTYAQQVFAARLGSQIGYLGSSFIAIGSGVATVSVNTTGLAHYWDRNQLLNGSADVSTLQQIQMTVDFTSTEMSGLTLRQFGLFMEDSGGKAILVENVNALNFNGTQEAEFIVTIKVF